MALYRRKPVVIDAIQFKGQLIRGMCNSQSCFTHGDNTSPHVHTIHGAVPNSKGYDPATGLPDGQVVNLAVGDYVIAEPDGIHYYPVKAAIFEASYERVED